MNRLQQIALSATLAVAACVIASNRPAQLASVRITAITPDRQPVAHVALTYTAGARPVSLIIDLITPIGRGSMTLDGLTLFGNVPLVASQSGSQQIITTAIHRSMGRTTRIVQQFD